MFACSALVHACLLASPLVPALLRAPREGAPPPVLGAARLGELCERAARRVVVQAERRELVEQARAARAAGGLRLGAFLLAANHLDARDEGRAFDRTAAEQRYAERLASLRAALERAPVRKAIPEVAADLHYIGRPGGKMGDALLAGGGSCEPLSHLVAALVHDSGQPDAIYLRYYGGNSDGITHLAPVYRDGEDEVDLLTGGLALRSGARFPAADLVEAYARVHGLSPPLPVVDMPAGGAPPSTGAEPAESPPPPLPGERSLEAGYPPNGDRYPGTIPFYATRAVHDADEAAPWPVDPGEQLVECAFYVRLAYLDPPTAAVGDLPVELHRVPSGDEIDRTFSLIRAVEQSVAGAGAEPAFRLMGLACLTAMYDRASVDLALVSGWALAKLSAEKARAAKAEGEKLLGSIDWRAPEGVRVARRLAERFSGRSFLLLVFDGGDRTVFGQLDPSDKTDWGWINTLAALVVNPSTRAQAIARLESMSLPDQIDVMHEVFRAHDRFRPWASNYALDAPAEALASAPGFLGAYRVFQGVAWGLWEGAQPAPVVLGRMAEGVRREQLGPRWEASFLEYYGRNALTLHASRPDRGAFEKELKRWLRERGHTDLDLYRSRLAGVDG